MKPVRSAVAAIALMVSPALMIGFAAPAQAAVDSSDPGKFVESLSDEGFRVLRTGSRASARGQFRTLLARYFAVDEIGDRLIRRWRPQITPAQYAAYKSALPGFLIGSYADRLYDYADADVKVQRVVPRGSSAAVMSQVIKPGASRPITAIWTVDRGGGGYQVSNLTVAGINLAITQQADFDAYVQRNGFDKLVAFMKARG